MTGDIAIRLPGTLDMSMRFFGRFSTRDLLRLGGPPVLTLLLVLPPTSGSDLLAILTGLVIGVGLYGIRLEDLPVDVYLRRRLAWWWDDHHIRDGPVAIHAHQYLTKQDGTVCGVVEVTPTNLELQTPNEQRALHQLYRELIETITYPVTVHSRQRHVSLDEYIAHLEESDRSDCERSHPDTGLEAVQTTYQQYCQHLNTDDLVTTDHYLVVHVTPATARLATLTTSILPRIHAALDTQSTLPDSVTAQLRTILPEPSDTDTQPRHEAYSECDRRCTDLVQACDTGSLAADRLTGPALHAFLEDVHTAAPNPTPEWTHVPNTEDESSDQEIPPPGEEYRRTVTITDWPTNLPLAWPLTVLRVDGLVDVTQHIRPQDSADTVTRLSRLVEQFEAEITSQEAAGHRGTNQYRARLQDANWLLDLLADRDDVACQYSVAVTPHDTDPERCRQTLDAVCTRLRTLQCGLDHLPYKTPDAYRIHSPLHCTPEIHTALMPGRSAAAGFPFATMDGLETSGTGVIYGEDQRDRTPILLDRFQWRSHSLARMGTVGSGKSYATKLELLRAWLAYDDLHVYVLDPKQEYTGLVTALGGATYTLGDDDYQFSHNAVCLTVPERGQDNNVSLLCSAIQDLYVHCAQHRHPTLVIIDEARILLNDEQGRQYLNQFVLEARDTNTAITMVAQNASHFTQHREGREILDNVPAKQFLRHERVGPDVIDYFQLSDRERHALYTLRTGTDSVCSDALLKVSGRVDTTLAIRATAAEHRLISRSEHP
ncbi:hypothetical protein [Halomontanus rarus]|uniref:hypothetical protein n=1 Tax=Halomontanus rarus TaxID=3034020 RepID=UPI001A9950D8